jgi:hypothetical protein
VANLITGAGKGTGSEHVSVNKNDEHANASAKVRASERALVCSLARAK